MDIVLRHSKITLKFQEAKPINYLNVELLTKSLQLWFLILVLLIRCFVQFGGLHYLTHRIQIISSLEGSSKNPGPWLRTSALQYLQYLGRPVNTTTCKHNALVYKSDWDEVSVLVHQFCLWSSWAILVLKWTILHVLIQIANVLISKQNIFLYIYICMYIFPSPSLQAVDHCFVPLSWNFIKLHNLNLTDV